MNRACRTLTAGFLTLTGAGFLTLSGTGIAQAQPAATPSACSQIRTVFQSFTAALNTDIKQHAPHATAMTAVDKFGNDIIKLAAHGSPALRSAAKTLATDYETELAANKINTARLQADNDRFDVLACTPKGAPRTGGGSSAGIQDPALFGAGGAAALAGLVVIGLSLRNRPRTSVDAG
jgi:hypothetical protein